MQHQYKIFSASPKRISVINSLSYIKSIFRTRLLDYWHESWGIEGTHTNSLYVGCSIHKTKWARLDTLKIISIKSLQQKQRYVRYMKEERLYDDIGFFRTSVVFAILCSNELWEPRIMCSAASQCLRPHNMCTVHCSSNGSIVLYPHKSIHFCLRLNVSGKLMMSDTTPRLI